MLIAGRILNALDYVGVIGGRDVRDRAPGSLVNEIAPRVHNSGHWTEAACLVDQFEQHVRAICGWPLGDGARGTRTRVMVNLLGDEVAAAPRDRGRAGASLRQGRGAAGAEDGARDAHRTANAVTGAMSGPRLAVRAVVLDRDGCSS